jgi:hypothetical protein
MTVVRALKLSGLAIVVAALFPALGGASHARSADNSVTFTDSRGEDAQGPDIATVVVSNDSTGLLTFQINVPNQASLSGEKIFDVIVDSDNNPATGDTDQFNPGADYAIELFQNQANLFKWDGQTYTRSAAGPAQATLVFANGAAGPAIKISTVELGNTKRFNFNTTAISGVTLDASGNLDFTNAHADIAPDAGHGLWNYTVKTTPLALRATKFRTVPSRPRAGGLFSVRMVAVRSDTGAAIQGGTVRCTARVGGRSLTARTHRIANKEAQCAWLIPGSARGQTMRGSITVVFEGKKATRAFSASVG